MKHRYSLMIVFMLIGLLTGSLVAHLLSDVAALSFATRSIDLSWSPAADLDFLKYDIHLSVKLSLLSLLGLVGAFWVYKKTR